MYKFKPGDRVHSAMGDGVVVAKNGFNDIPERLYAVQLDEWKSSDFSSTGIYLALEKYLTLLPAKCPTCGK